MIHAIFVLQSLQCNWQPELNAIGSWARYLGLGTLGKSLATRGSQEAQRTKTRHNNSNPIEPAQSKHSLHFSTKFENVIENASVCVHFGMQVATLDAQMRLYVSLGAILKIRNKGNSR